MERDERGDAAEPYVDEEDEDAGHEGAALEERFELRVLYRGLHGRAGHGRLT